jgi:large subunit ribosomal protein L15
MPLHRRIPKRGFRNPFKKRYVIVKTGHLKKFPPNSIVDSSTLLARGVIKEVRDGIKILCGGKGVPSGLKVMVHGISKGARLIIEQAGGSVQIIKGRR